MARFRYRWMQNPWWRVAVGVLAIGAGVMSLTQETTCNGVPMHEGETCRPRRSLTTRTYDEMASRQQMVGVGASLVGVVSLGFGANTFRTRARNRRLLEAVALSHAQAPGASPLPGAPRPPLPTAPAYTPPPHHAPPSPSPLSAPGITASSASPSLPPPMQWGPPGS